MTTREVADDTVRADADLAVQSCANCLYWKRPVEERMFLGTCRRYPPHTNESPGQPQTGSDDWCGEWCVRTFG